MKQLLIDNLDKEEHGAYGRPHTLLNASISGFPTALQLRDQYPHQFYLLKPSAYYQLCYHNNELYTGHIDLKHSKKRNAGVSC